MTTATDLAAAIERMIEEKVAFAIERRMVTPSSLRIAKGLTIEQLAQAVSISESQLRRYESGLVDNIAHKAAERRMKKIASVLDVSFAMYRDAVLSVRK